MHLLYVDETNCDTDADRFFIYGGVAIHADDMPKFSHTVDAIRQKYGYAPSDFLKFNTNDRPTSVDPAAHKDAKQEVLSAATKCRTMMFSSFTLHAVARDADTARFYAINTAAYHFDCILHWPDIDSHGLLLLDPFEHESFRSHICEKFNTGVQFSSGKPARLKRILGVHVAPIGSSHMCSLTDIAIGSLRYAVNERNNPARQAVVKTLMQQLRPLLLPTWLTRPDMTVTIRPRDVRAPSHREKYDDLRGFLARELGVEEDLLSK